MFMTKPITMVMLLSFLVMLFSLISRQLHLLSLLLCLEGMFLYLICFLLIHSNYQLTNMSMSMIILLTMSVSSASTGLAIMIMMSRMEGGDSTTNHLLSSC